MENPAKPLTRCQSREGLSATAHNHLPRPASMPSLKVSLGAREELLRWKCYSGLLFSEITEMFSDSSTGVGGAHIGIPIFENTLCVTLIFCCVALAWQVAEEPTSGKKGGGKKKR